MMAVVSVRYPATFHLRYIFHFSLRRFRRAETFLYIIITSRPQPTLSHSTTATNRISLQDVNRATTCTLLLRITAPWCLALERDLSKKKKKPTQSRSGNDLQYGTRAIFRINHCSDLRQHLEKDNRVVSCPRILLYKDENIKVNTYIA